MLLFIIAPLAGLFIKTSPVEFFETVNDQEVTGSISLTLGVSLVTTLVFAIGSVPLAYWLARTSFRGREIIQSLVDLPVSYPSFGGWYCLLGMVYGIHGGPGCIGNRTRFCWAPTRHRNCHGFCQCAISDPVGSGWICQCSLTLGDGRHEPRCFTLALVFNGQPSTGCPQHHHWNGHDVLQGVKRIWAIVIIAYHPMVTPVLIYERFGAFGLKYSRPVAALFVTGLPNYFCSSSNSCQPTNP